MKNKPGIGGTEFKITFKDSMFKNDPILSEDIDLDQLARELVDKINNQEYPKEWEGILKLYGKPKATLKDHTDLHKYQDLKKNNDTNI
jgi:hypothetical protein